MFVLFAPKQASEGKHISVLVTVELGRPSR